MPIPSPELSVTTSLIDQAQKVLDGAIGELRDHGGVDKNQGFAYDLAHASSAIAAARACVAYAKKGDTEAQLVTAFLAMALADLAARVLGSRGTLGSVGRLVRSLPELRRHLPRCRLSGLARRNSGTSTPRT